MKTKWDRIFHNCPGAWTGAPQCDHFPAHITIDPTRIIDAIAYLKRKRVNLIESALSELPSCPGGLMLRFRC